MKIISFTLHGKIPKIVVKQPRSINKVSLRVTNYHFSFIIIHFNPFIGQPWGTPYIYERQLSHFHAIFQKNFPSQMVGTPSTENPGSASSAFRNTKKNLWCQVCQHFIIIIFYDCVSVIPRV